MAPRSAKSDRDLLNLLKFGCHISPLLFSPGAAPGALLGLAQPLEIGVLSFEF